MSDDWSPNQYLKFASPRLRPALDLINRIEPAVPPAVVYDLGCGTGSGAKVLAARFPDARVSGVDSSAAMLEQAAAEGPARIDWVRADLDHWRPAGPADLIYSNAALNWIDDHAAFFPRLIEGLTPGGLLAVQMPRNFGAPSHALMAEVARSGPWAAVLAPLLRPEPVAPPEFYWDLLSPLCSEVEIWETEYIHVLEGPDPVVEWTRGTALKPLLDALDDPADFLAAYTGRVARAYPPRPDGKTLFPFRRLFLLARR